MYIYTTLLLFRRHVACRHPPENGTRQSGPGPSRHPRTLPAAFPLRRLRQCCRWGRKPRSSGAGPSNCSASPASFPPPRRSHSPPHPSRMSSTHAWLSCKYQKVRGRLSNFKPDSTGPAEPHSQCAPTTSPAKIIYSAWKDSSTLSYESNLMSNATDGDFAKLLIIIIMKKKLQRKKIKRCT